MRPPAALAPARAVPPAEAPAPDGEWCGQVVPWPYGSTAGHIPGSARDGALPAEHSTSASPGPVGLPEALAPTRAAPAPRRRVWWAHTAHRRARPGGPVGAHAAASAAESLR